MSYDKEKRAQESESFYQDLINRCHDAILIYSGDKYVFANPAAMKFFDIRSAEELVSVNVLETIHPDYRQLVSQWIGQIDNGLSASPLEVKLLFPDRSFVDVEITGAKTEYSGKPAIQLVMRDVTERKQTEQKLRESEERYRDLYENAPNAYFSIGNDGLIKKCNQQACSLLGYKSEDLIGQPVFNLYTDTKDGKQKAKLVFEKFIIKEPIINEELQMQKSDGACIWISLTVTPITDADGNVIESRSIVTDISKHKQAEAALRESEARFRSVLENAVDGIYRINVQSGCYDYISPSTETMIGFSNNGLMTMGPEKVSTMIHPDDFPEVQAAMARLEETGVEETIFRFQTKSGNYRWISAHMSLTRDDAGKPLYRNNNIRDITEIKHAETALRESEARFRSVLENAVDAIYRLNVQSDCYDYISPSIETLIGFSNNEIMAMGHEKASAMIHPDDFPEVRAAMARLEEKDMAGTEFRYRTKSGDYRWISDRMSLTRDDAGKPLYRNGNIRDITVNKQSEAALRESEARFRSVLENAVDVIYRLNLQSNRFDYLSPSTETLMEVSNNELMDMGIEKISARIHPDDMPELRATMKRLEETGAEKALYRFLAKNGEYRWISDHMSLTRDDAGKPLYRNGNIRDITESKKIAEALQAKQEELTAANEELQARQEELTAANEELQAQQEEMIAANEELQAQQEELTAMNEELQAQQEELLVTYEELKRQDNEIREHARAANLAREEAEQRAAELDATIASIGAGVIVFNTSGRILRINEYASNLLGYNNDDYQKSYRERVPKIMLCKPDGAPYTIEELPLARALRGEIIRDEELILVVSGKPIWHSATFAPIYNNGSLKGVILVFSDITERKLRMEHLLASERELLKITLNSLGEGVIAVDREERIMFINDTAVKLSGFSGNEAVGKPLVEVFNILDEQTGEFTVTKVSRRVFKGSLLVTRDLREIPVAINTSPIVTIDGQIIGTVIVLQDITEKLKTEQELLKTQKLESLGILAGGIAHDFNNILAAILTNIELAARKSEKNEDIKKYLSNTIETTRKASNLTKQLLTFSRGGAPVKKDASLVELIQDTAEFALRGSNIKAEFAVPDDLWPASIDEGQISQVLHNLVINAKQAMPKGGFIHIIADNVSIREDAPQSVRFKPGDYVKITVQDQGTGIPREYLSKIFDPFFTTKKDGSGLGLTTSYSIINRHNGYIEVDSQEGAGTIFFIHLPALKGVVLEAEVNREIVATRALKILIMEDEEKISQAVGQMLESYGHRVVLTTEGTQLIECYRRARESGEPFELVIMDLTIPGGMGGQEAIKHLRDIDPQIKAIVSSGYVNDQIINDYKRFGFCGVITKPYKFNELNEVINRVIEQS